MITRPFDIFRRDVHELIMVEYGDDLVQCLKCLRPRSCLFRVKTSLICRGCMLEAFGLAEEEGMEVFLLEEPVSILIASDSKTAELCDQCSRIALCAVHIEADLLYTLCRECVLKHFQEAQVYYDLHHGEEWSSKFLARPEKEEDDDSLLCLSEDETESMPSSSPVHKKSKGVISSPTSIVHVPDTP